MKFRHIAKEALPIQAPGDIVFAIRERAARERRSISSIATELLCVGLGQDPAEYGLTTDSAKAEVAMSA